MRGTHANMKMTTYRREGGGARGGGDYLRKSRGVQQKRRGGYVSPTEYKDRTEEN